MKCSKVTLALGGGGARGVAHLGVIEVLLEAGLEIERIVGVSSGSLAGALYAFGEDIKSVQQQTLEYLLSPTFQAHQRILFGASSGAGDETTGGVFTWYVRAKDYLRANRIFHRILRTSSLIPGVVLQDVINNLLPEADLSAARIPLNVVAVDLISGHKVVLEKGDVRDAIRASSSLPGIFPPVKIDDMLLCDIGVFDSLPTIVARAFASECVVAVDVSSKLKPLPSCETALDVLMRMDEIGESLFRKYVRPQADVLIHPHVAGIEWFDFSRSDEVIEAGRKAARLALHEFDRTSKPRLPTAAEPAG